MTQRPASTTQLQIQRFKDQQLTTKRDWLVTEEPLEIRLLHQTPAGLDQFSFTVTMRTPGHDFELVAGLLFAEGVIQEKDDIDTMAFCVDEGVEQQYNIVNVQLHPNLTVDKARFSRHVYTASSCGVCGKASLEALTLDGCQPLNTHARVRPAQIMALAATLNQHQSLFKKTGGLHAAGIFDEAKRPHVIREDVGRHNAVDKAVGHHLLKGALPLKECALVLSGRAGFELLQKALRAQIPIVIAVGAPSSLAVDLARQFNITLIGFVGDQKFNVYHGSERVMADHR